MQFLPEISELLEGLFKVFYPPQCAACDSSNLVHGYALCGDCLSKLKCLPRKICTKCGFPANTTSKCTRCSGKDMFYRTARFGYYYYGPMTKIITGLKYGGQLYKSRVLGDLSTESFCRYYNPCDYDAIIPIPVHKKRLIARGFNQVVEIGSVLARNIGIPINRTALRKSRETKPQVGLRKSERLVNQNDSFRVGDNTMVRGKRLLLLDDVSTTGATIREASRALILADAAVVDVLVPALRDPTLSDDDSES